MKGVVFVLLTFFFISFITNILGSLNPAVTEAFGLSDTLAGFLPFAFFIAYGVMSIPAGMLLETYGQKRLLVAAFLLTTLGSLMVFLIPQFTVFLISLFTIGTGMAVLQVVINPLLRHAGGEENFSFNSVLAQLVFGGASFVAPLVYSYLVTRGEGAIADTATDWLSLINSENFGWVKLYGLFALLSGVMLLFVASQNLPELELNKDEQIGSWSLIQGLLKKRLVWAYFLGIFAYVGAEQGISFWMSSFLEEYHQIDPETQGASTVANFWGLMTLGGVLGLVLLKIKESQWVLKVFTAMTILALAIGLYGSASLALWTLPMAGFFMAVMYPIIISLGLNSVQEHHGSFAGILVSGIMGGALIQVLIGFLSDQWGLQAGMSFNFLLLLYILSIAFWAKPLIENKRK